jgi:hypothetical protein
MASEDPHDRKDEVEREDEEREEEKEKGDNGDDLLSYDKFCKSLETFTSTSQTTLPGNLLNQEIYLDVSAFPFWRVYHPLIATCVNGDLAATSLLLTSGVSPNTHEPEGYLDTCLRPTTPLQGAALSGNADMISLLLSHGAAVNPLANDRGITPHALPFAAAEGDDEFVSLLLAKGADPSTDSGRDGAALHAAAYYGHGHLISLLLAHGTDINGSAGDFVTPLKAACAPRFDNTDVVTALLNAGADIEAEREPQGGGG